MSGMRSNRNLSLFLFSFCVLMFDGINLNTLKVIPWKRSNRNVYECECLFLFFRLYFWWHQSQFTHYGVMEKDKTQIFNFVSVFGLCFHCHVWWNHSQFIQDDIMETVKQVVMIFSCFLVLTFDGITLNTLNGMSWKRSNRTLFHLSVCLFCFFVLTLDGITLSSIKVVSMKRLNKIFSCVWEFFSCLFVISFNGNTLTLCYNCIDLHEISIHSWWCHGRFVFLLFFYLWWNHSLFTQNNVMENDKEFF